MKVIVVCGSPWSKSDQVHSLLRHSGLSEPAVPASGVQASIGDWHEKLFAHLPLPQLRAAAQPGKAWEQLAGDIFIANWNKPQWGWNDARSTWLLNFWRDFEPGLGFVLVTGRPELTIARAMTLASPTPWDSRELVDSWCAYNHELLSFFNRNRDRALLVDDDTALAAPAALVQACANKFGLELSAPGDLNLGGDQIDSRLATLLSEQLIKQFPGAKTLQSEIDSSVRRFAESDASDTSGDDAVASDLEVAIIETRELMFVAHKELQLLKLVKDNLERDLAELQVKLDQSQSELQAVKKSDGDARRTIVAKENELRTTKELHASQIKDKENELARAKEQHAAQLKEKENEIDKANESRTIQKKEAERLQQQMRQSVETLESKLRTANDDLAATRAAGERFEKEYELTVLQLHQVQEELEGYFLQYQEKSKSVDGYRQRWGRLLARHPEYLDWRSIDLVAVAVGESGATTRWRIDGLFHNDRELPPFDFDITNADGNPALVFFRGHAEPSENGALLQWPREAADLVELRLQPGGADRDTAHRWSLLYGLTTSDWLLAKGLCATLAQQLRSRYEAQDNSLEPTVGYWLDQLQILREQFRQAPPSWRYDSLTLRHQQLNPDYEHLWFRLDNVEFGNRRWDRFEFRLGASLIHSDGFSVYPKLEFPRPEHGSSQFENWFVETDDELGPRYELRFALAESAMDMAVFNRLTVNDQLQMLAIIIAIPRLLSQLEQGGAKIARPWEDWQRLAAGIIATVQKNLAAPAIEAPTQELEVVETQTNVPARGNQRGSRRSGSTRR